MVQIYFNLNITMYIIVFLFFNYNNNYDLARLVHDQCNLHTKLIRYTLVYPMRLYYSSIFI